MRLSEISFADHAVEQFVKRHAPHMSVVAARQYLEQHAGQLRHVKERSLLGQELYELADPRCLLVVKRDRRMNCSICVTVLPDLPKPQGDVDPWADEGDDA